MIGSPERLKAFFTLGIESPEIEVRTRKFGSLVDEMSELAQSEEDGKMQTLAECAKADNQGQNQQPETQAKNMNIVRL